MLTLRFILFLHISGRMYNKIGLRENWWTDDEVKSFNNVSQCFIDQYESYIIRQINQSVSLLILNVNPEAKHKYSQQIDQNNI